MLAIIDSSFLYAVVDKNNKNHEKAAQFLNDNPNFTYVIPFSILQETCEIIDYEIAKQVAVKFLKEVLKTFHIELHEHKDLIRAIELIDYYSNFKNMDIDFSDVLFISVCERLKTNNILTFRKNVFEEIVPKGFKKFNFLI